MKKIAGIMGMPIAIEVQDGARNDDFEAAFAYLRAIDRRFSTYRHGSEISALNRGELALEDASEEMREVFALAEETRRETDGYFDIRTPAGAYDPSGLVKGWAIRGTARLLAARGLRAFYVDVGGDIEAHGARWAIGIRNPLEPETIVKVVELENAGIATSGTYLRGAHVWDPHAGAPAASAVASITVIGPDVYEADRFATAAFAMGEVGIGFIERHPGLEGYQIDKNGIATMTTGFGRYVQRAGAQERAPHRSSGKDFLNEASSAGAWAVPRPFHTPTICT